MSSEKMLVTGAQVPDCDRRRRGEHHGLKVAMGFAMGGLAVSLMFQVTAMYNAKTDQTVAALRERIAVLETRVKDMSISGCTQDTQESETGTTGTEAHLDSHKRAKRQSVSVIGPCREGKDGRDGRDGRDGTPGAQGPPGCCHDNGSYGLPGPPGPEGPPGLPGSVNPSSTDYYNYYDEMAQSICTAATNQPSFIFAIRRDCRSNGDGLTCNAMCTSRRAAMITSVGNQGSTSACIDAIHLYKNRPVLSSDHQAGAGKIGLAAYHYFSGGCSWKANHCGPNYCCCRLLP
ncbi:uncharacterized protein LOC144863378 isoform X1 [Branchiostoma floridae x Branchiostoma japonicum]